MTMKNNLIVYVDAECAMCTIFGDWVRKNCNDVLVKSNSALGQDLSDIAEKTIIVHNKSKNEIYTKFFAILNVLKNHKNAIVRTCSILFLFVFSLITLEPLYNFISKNRLLFFKEKDSCEIPKH